MRVHFPTSTVADHKFVTFSCVFMLVQLNKCVVVYGSDLQRGHRGDGCLSSSILFKYESSRGHFWFLHLIRLLCCLPTPMTLASGGGGESDVPACGPPPSFSVHLASSAVTPAGSVHKSKGDNVVRMWVQLKR